MQRIYYAGGEFVTTDDVAIEFLNFAVDLAKRSTATAVEVPTVQNGEVKFVTFVIGPSSQVASEPAPESEEVDMAAALQQLRSDREQESRRGSVAIYDEGTGTFFIDDL